MAKMFYLNEDDHRWVQRMLRHFRLTERGGMAPRRNKMFSGGGGGISRAQITNLTKSNGVLEVNLVDGSNTKDTIALDVFIFRDKSTSSAFVTGDHMPTLSTSGQNSFVLVQADQNGDTILVTPTLLPVTTIEVVTDVLVSGSSLKKQTREEVQVFTTDTESAAVTVSGGTGTTCS